MSRKHRKRRLRKLPPATLPSLFTLGNLLCGFASIFFASKHASILAQRNGETALVGIPEDVVIFGAWSPLTMAAALIFLGMICDALDGRVARLTKSTSEMGAQLDSMADMVTFGIAPAFMAIQLVGIGTPFFGQPAADTIIDRAVLVVGGIYVACTALRLARFNTENEENDSHTFFKGLPSPGAGGTIASLVLLHEYYLASANANGTLAYLTAIVMVSVGLLVAFAMVSSFRYVHVMNRYLRDRAPIEYIVMVVIVVALAAIRFQLSLAAVFTIYALSAPTMAISRRLLGVSPNHPHPQRADDHETDSDNDPSADSDDQDPPDVPTQNYRLHNQA